MTKDSEQEVFRRLRYGLLPDDEALELFLQDRERYALSKQKSWVLGKNLRGLGASIATSTEKGHTHQFTIPVEWECYMKYGEAGIYKISENPIIPKQECNRVTRLMCSCGEERERKI